MNRNTSINDVNRQAKIGKEWLESKGIIARQMIERIVVSNLFGKYDYDIHINTDEDVAIFTAPNGCGKTTIFSFLDFIFNPSVESFRVIAKTPFDSFQCFLADETCVTLKKTFESNSSTQKPIKTSSVDRATAIVRLRYMINSENDSIHDNGTYDFLISVCQGQKKTTEISFLSKFASYYGKYYQGSPSSRISAATESALNRLTEEIIMLEKKRDSLASMLADFDQEKKAATSAKRLAEVAKEYEHLAHDLDYVESRIAASRAKYDRKKTEASSMHRENAFMQRAAEEDFNALQSCISDVTNLINEYLYSDLVFIPINRLETNLLDKLILNKITKVTNIDTASFTQIQTFFTELLGEKIKEFSESQQAAKAKLLPETMNYKGSIMSYEEFSKEWAEYLGEIDKYSELGLVTSGEFELAEIDRDDYDDNRKLISTYLKLYKETMVPFSDCYDDLKLFKDIFDKYNSTTGKKLIYGPEGIRIRMDNRDVPLDRLSSGEKNALFMFFYLIFKIPSNGIVLIDEPEISLHIEWQEDYVDQLLRICRKNKLQVILATHSPHIVNGHFDELMEY